MWVSIRTPDGPGVTSIRIWLITLRAVSSLPALDLLLGLDADLAAVPGLEGDAAVDVVQPHLGAGAQRDGLVEALLQGDAVRRRRRRAAGRRRAAESLGQASVNPSFAVFFQVDAGGPPGTGRLSAYESGGRNVTAAGAVLACGEAPDRHARWPENGVAFPRGGAGRGGTTDDGRSEAAPGGDAASGAGGDRGAPAARRAGRAGARPRPPAGGPLPRRRRVHLRPGGHPRGHRLRRRAGRPLRQGQPGGDRAHPPSHLGASATASGTSSA